MSSPVSSSKTVKENIDSKIVSEAFLYVRRLLDNQLPDAYLFHTFKHTKEVLKYVEIIGKSCELDENDMNLLRISALFHDTGYIRNFKSHEEESVKIALKFLKQNHIEESKVQSIATAIRATKVPQNPQDIYSKILCDADLINFTYDNYLEIAELMRIEWKRAGIASLSEKEFHQNSINLFEAHHYHTDYGKKILASKKEIVLKKIKNRVNRL